ncbi:MAG: hypothetical protein KF687_08340 [Cyclobacteriaceae bacterium]|nr:hypothetical protein [Cyclobacteriaceae bacterium]
MRRGKGFLFTIVVSILFMVQSCDNYYHPKYNLQATWKCHYDQDLSYESTKTRIAGLWEWRYVICCGETSKPYQNSTESKGLQIEFNADGTGSLNVNNTTKEFTWDIDLKGTNLYGFSTTPFISQIHGRLLFCDNIMMCNTSYLDGSDNFFEKINSGGN